MKQLPDPKTYELENKYMPWGETITKVLELIVSEAPRNAKLMDLMCGPGFLLENINKKRPDLELSGVDIDPRYIRYAGKGNSNINYVVADINTMEADAKYDLVLMTAGLHHVAYKDQGIVLKKLAKMVGGNGQVVLADCFIGSYKDDNSRKLAAANFDHEYLNYVIHKNAPREIIDATVNILHNDVLADGEYKDSLKNMVKKAEHYFSKIKIIKVWPQHDSDHGDYILTMRV